MNQHNRNEQAAVKILTFKSHHLAKYICEYAVLCQNGILYPSVLGFIKSYVKPLCSSLLLFSYFSLGLRWLKRLSGYGQKTIFLPQVGQKSECDETGNQLGCFVGKPQINHWGNFNVFSHFKAISHEHCELQAYRTV